MNTKDLKRKLLKKKKRTKRSRKDYLSSGSTLLNLACSGKYYGAFIKGKYYYFVGDSISGKTFLSLTCLAEASINLNFKDYRLIYDNAEDGALMDIKKFFGPAVFYRMQSPNMLDSSRPAYSTTIEEFYYNVDDQFRKRKPFIYILDSMDSLSSEPEQDKFEEHKNASRKGKTAPGSYGDGKAKKNSSGMRRLLAPLRDTNSILIVISQTRDNLSFGFEKKTRSGGKALRFYATVEIWLSVKQKITKFVKGKKRQVGILCGCQTKKNRITGKERYVTVPIYHSYGMDDMGSCVDYLIDEGHWKKNNKGKYRAKEFKINGTREAIIKYIEKNELEKDLRSIVGEVWDEVEEACNLKRKRRYE